MLAKNKSILEIESRYIRGTIIRSSSFRGTKRTMGTVCGNEEEG